MTVRTRAELEAIFATLGYAHITPENMRDFLESIPLIVESLIVIDGTTLELAADRTTIQTDSAPDFSEMGKDFNLYAGAGANATTPDSGSQGGALALHAGAGGTTADNDGGIGGSVGLTAGSGGSSSGGTDTGNGALGGSVFVNAGPGGAGRTGDGGNGGDLEAVAGIGGATVSGQGGNGGNVRFEGAPGGAATGGSEDGGLGGVVSFRAGNGGASAGGEDGVGGDIDFIVGSGSFPGRALVAGDMVFYNQALVPRDRYKSAAQEVTTTTLASDSALTVTLTQFSTYYFKFNLFVLNDGGAEGLKLALSGTTDVAALKAQIKIWDDTTNTLAGFGRVTAFGSSVGAGLSVGDNYAEIEGTITTSTTGGTFLLQFAQNAAGANAGVHIQAQSSLITKSLS